ncbi:hypothetical protein C7974DRAFT_372027 [Boeremia exigua]|uniref:uncharacterized protein n=1 Tax=Boeremia exigua TaxID=749465 RepID=UPI001E8DA610|nr:uncharacterized protein C7974DRAFT_372027 [Boeremia exigua]KAH6642031.1 hypothetical protein C7974DRAFT_372027 [Boeremia exigua]
MAKTAKLKKKQVTPHSRAARRAASPSIPLPKPTSPTSTPAKPAKPTPAHHVLSAPSGIRKKPAKTTRAQRVRAEKAMERAADDMDKWALKREKSIVKAAAIKGRAKGWEDINEWEDVEEGEEEGVEGKKVKAKKGKKVRSEVEGGAVGDVGMAEVPEVQGAAVQEGAVVDGGDEML